MAQDFNWVRERHSCSTVAMFAKLKLDIEGDVSQRNKLRQESAYYEFKLVSSTSAFAVVREGNLNDSVTFSIENEAIIVKDSDGKVILKATLTLNNDGECRFQVDGEEYESWHLRKRVLERMFFVGVTT